MKTPTKKCYDPKEKLQDMISLGYDESYAKDFINKQVRGIKSLANNRIARAMAEANGYDLNSLENIQELA